MPAALDLIVALLRHPATPFALAGAAMIAAGICIARAAATNTARFPSPPSIPVGQPRS